jgi:hypothetical protein
MRSGERTEESSAYLAGCVARTRLIWMDTVGIDTAAVVLMMSYVGISTRQTRSTLWSNCIARPRCDGHARALPIWPPTRWRCGGDGATSWPSFSSCETRESRAVSLVDTHRRRVDEISARSSVAGCAGHVTIGGVRWWTYLDLAGLSHSRVGYLVRHATRWLLDGVRVVCGASGAAAIGRGLFVRVLNGTNQVEQWQRPIMMEAREGRIFELGSMGECTSLGLPWRAARGDEMDWREDLGGEERRDGSSACAAARGCTDGRTGGRRESKMLFAVNSVSFMLPSLSTHPSIYAAATVVRCRNRDER